MVRIDVIGTITAEANPAYFGEGGTCGPDSQIATSEPWRCYDHPYWGDYDAAGVNDGYASLKMLFRVKKSDGSYLFIGYPSSVGPGEAHRYKTTSEAGVLEMSQIGFNDPYPGRSRTTGSRTYTVSTVGPLTAEATDHFVGMGDTIVVHAGAAGGAIANTTWRFAPNDTLAIPRGPGSNGGTYVLSQCAGMSSCAFVPPWYYKSGRVYVNGTVDGLNYTGPQAVTQPIWVDRQPELTMTCTPGTVTRGDQVSCTASTMPSGAQLEVKQWAFTGAPVPIADTTDATSWSGRLVVGGTVSVTASVEGRSDTIASTTVVVTPRNWRWNSGQWSYQAGAAMICSNARPAVGVLLGWNMNANAPSCAGDLQLRVQPDLRFQPNGGYQVGAVSSGPNGGLWYITAATFTMPRASNLNPEWLSGGTTYPLPAGQQAQLCQSAMNLPTGAAVAVNFYDFNEICMGNDVDALIAAAWAHEGFGSQGNNGHESVGRAAAGRLVNDPYAAIEGLVQDAEGLLRTYVGNNIWPLAVAITQEGGDHSLVTGNWPGGILWTWDPPSNAYQQTFIGPF
jgi:hypothetical protein